MKNEINNLNHCIIIKKLNIILYIQNYWKYQNINNEIALKCIDRKYIGNINVIIFLDFDLFLINKNKLLINYLKLKKNKTIFKANNLKNSNA